MLGGSNRISSHSQSSNQPSPSSSFRKSRRKNESDFHGGSTTSTISGTDSFQPKLPSSNTVDDGGASVLSSGRDKGFKQHYWYKRKPIFTLIIPGILLGFCYFYSISHHFHSITNFSSLTRLEKELSLPVQTSVRYASFKQIAEAETLIQGIRSALRSRKAESLGPEIVLGSGYHLTQRLRLAFPSSDPCWAAELDKKDWRANTDKRDAGKCSSSLADPITFYIKAHWAIESAFLAFLYITSSILSDSYFGGFLSSLTFILNHPQLNDLDRIFPDGDKIGSYLAAVHLILVPHFLLTKSHPSWTNVVKMGLSVAVMIISWEKEAQWILCTQLLVSLLIHFSDGLSPYRLYIVLASHIVGWEYSTLVHLDISFLHWSFYGYFLIASLLCIFMMEPVLDKCFGDKLEKWMFLRAIMLTLAFHILFVNVRFRLGPLLQEDVRNSCFYPTMLNAMRRFYGFSYLFYFISHLIVQSRMSLAMGRVEGNGPDNHNNETLTVSSKSPVFGGGVMALGREFDAALPWLRAIEEPRRIREDDLWARSSYSDLKGTWNRESKQKAFTSTGNGMSRSYLQVEGKKTEPPVMLRQMNDESTEGNDNSRRKISIGNRKTMMGSAKEDENSSIDEEEDILEEEDDNDEENVTIKTSNTIRFNDVISRLRLCNQSKSIFPLSALIRDNAAFLLTLAALSLLSFTSTQKLSGRLRTARTVNGMDSNSYIIEQVPWERNHNLWPTMAYLALTVAALIFLTIKIHHKFYFILLMHISFLLAFVAQPESFTWIYTRVFPGKEKQCHWMLLLILISVMTGFAKLRVDRLNEQPHQEDPGLGESIELVNWWNHNFDPNSTDVEMRDNDVLIFSPSDVATKVYASALVPFQNRHLNLDSYHPLESEDHELILGVQQLMCKKEESTPLTLHQTLSNLRITHLMLTPQLCSDSSFLSIIPSEDSQYKVRSPIKSDANQIGDDKLPEEGRKRGRMPSQNTVMMQLEKEYDTLTPKENDGSCDIRSSLCDQFEVQKGEALCTNLLSNQDRDYERIIEPFKRVFYNRLFTVLEL